MKASADNQGRTSLDGLSVGHSVVIIAVMLATGIWCFRRMEKTFADAI
jgi:hypothetical protein